jgi:hypothetical protein
MLRRAAAAVCVCIVLGGVLGGCAPKKTVATPTPAATVNPVFAKSAVLARNLKNLGPVSGDIVGTMTVGGDKRTISGSVVLNDTSSHISFIVNGVTSDIHSEIIVNTHRYVSRDNTIWVERGTEDPSTGLAATLTRADTSVDAGVSTVEGLVGHKIMSAQDKVDVAQAMGLDTWTFDQETTTLHIWADPNGKVLGFGADMAWKLLLGGVLTDVSSKFDVMFTSNVAETITAPKNPWLWTADFPAGISLGYQNPFPGVTNLRYTADSMKIPGTLSDVVKSYVDTMGGGVNGIRSITVDGEDASWFTYDPPNGTYHGVVLIVVHDKIIYTVTADGAPADQLKIDTGLQQVFSTIEFTR